MRGGDPPIADIATPPTMAEAREDPVTFINGMWPHQAVQPFAYTLNRDWTVRSEDLLGEVLGRVGLRRGESSFWSRPGHGMSTFRTELRRSRQLATTVRASPSQRGRALFAELCPRAILVLAPGTLHHPTLMSQGGGGRDGGTNLAPGHQRVNNGLRDQKVAKACTDCAHIDWSINTRFHAAEPGPSRSACVSPGAWRRPGLGRVNITSSG